MYTAEEFRQDVIANLKGNDDFPSIVMEILEHSKFQFNDTRQFTKIIWDTYERNLVIFCAPKDRIELEKYKEALFSLCTKVHDRQDDYLIMSLEIIAKNDILAVSENNAITDQKIIISTKIVIDRSSTTHIGHGGFGIVYKYYDNEKEEFMAIKIYEPSIFQDSEPEIMKKRFLREGKKLLNYSHPNVVKAFDYGFLGDKSAYIKMEYIEGEKISDFVLKNNPLSSVLIDNLCFQYIDAMAYIHSKTDMHRDISYSNVMVSQNNEIKVLDFGFARNADDTNYDTAYKDIQRKFVIPNEKYTFRTEIYCIGAILYTIITGSLFENPDLTLIDGVECNTRLKSATKICLADKPEKRFSDAMKLQEFIYSEEAVGIQKNFSLDFFRKILNDNDIVLHFAPQSLPTEEIITNWMENEYKKYINSCVFQSTINLLALLKYISGVSQITYYKNIDYNLDKTQYVELFDFYNLLSENMKEIFVRNILLIILEISKDDYYALPFD